MFQLILGISLSVILLFVITLLLTEVAATYPMMNRYEGNIFVRFNDFLFKKAEDRNKARLLLLVLSCILALCITAFIISSVPEKSVDTLISNTTATGGEKLQGPPPVVTNKTLTDSYSELALGFSFRTKWEDNKIYANAYVRFDGKPIWSFKDWSFYLLDKDGFQVAKYSFALSDLIFETSPGGAIIGLAGRATPQELTLAEYQKIDRLQVVLDRRKAASDLE